MSVYAQAPEDAQVLLHRGNAKLSMAHQENLACLGELSSVHLTALLIIGALAVGDQCAICKWCHRSVGAQQRTEHHQGSLPWQLRYRTSNHKGRNRTPSP